MTTDYVDTHAVALRQEPQAANVTLFGTDDPGEIISRASKKATALKAVIDQQNLAVQIGDSAKKHVMLEGWTLLGSLTGVFPVELGEPEPIVDSNGNGGFRSHYEAQTINGAIIGGATAYCTRSEKRWKSADDYAIASMAQTRAAAKALKMPLGFVMSLAGYSPTPAEEMQHESERSQPAADFGECPDGHPMRAGKYGPQCSNKPDTAKYPPKGYHNWQPPKDAPQARTRPAPVSREEEAGVVDTTAREIPAAQHMWENVKTWAREHGTDAERLTYYLTTDKGKPGKVTPAAITMWEHANPDKTVDDLYQRYVAGESPQPDPAEQAAFV